MIDDPGLNEAMLEAAGPLLAAAHEYGPLPAASSEAFLWAPVVVRQAVLVVGGISRVHFGDPVLTLQREASNDVHGGDNEFWRRVAAEHVPYAELQRRRAQLGPLADGGSAA